MAKSTDKDAKEVVESKVTKTEKVEPKPKKSLAKAKTETKVAQTETVTSDVAEPTGVDEKPTKKATKAGPKSAKAVAEAEAKAVKKEAAKSTETSVKAPSPKQKRLVWHGKKYRKVSELIDPEMAYDLEAAIKLAKTTSPVKFDATVELHANLGVDPRQADQMVRASIVLPAGTGRSRRIAVIAPAADWAAAKAAGADLVGEADIIKQIEQGKLDFDLLITVPAEMAALGKLAKILGPKGLMPNPKSGSVTNNLVQAVSEAKAGRVEFRIDKQAIVHQAIGKVSFSEVQLLDNAATLIRAIIAAKPAAAKGSYVLGMSLSTSMGPGIRLNHTSAIASTNLHK